jgi:hypothetical protein
MIAIPPTAEKRDRKPRRNLFFQYYIIMKKERKTIYKSGRLSYNVCV